MRIRPACAFPLLCSILPMASVRAGEVKSPFPGAIAVKWDQPLKVAIVSKPVKAGKELFSIVRLGKLSLRLAEDRRLTATFSGGIVQYADVVYRISLAVFDAKGKLLGTAAHDEKVEYMRAGGTPTLVRDINFDFGQSVAFRQVAFFLAAISEPVAEPQPSVPDGKATTKRDVPKAKTDLDKAVDGLKETYRLIPGEDVKCIEPLFPQARQDFLRLRDGQEPRIAALHFLWKNGELKPWGGMNGARFNLMILLGNLMQIFPEETEGDEDLLATELDADFITREGVPAEKLMPSLEAVLRKQLKLPVKLSLKHVNRRVYVASGKFSFEPVPGRPQDRIEIYAKHLTENPAVGGGGSGPLPEFLQWAGRFVGLRIIAGDIQNAPKGFIRWHDNLRMRATEEQAREDRHPITVFQRLSAQTGLEFREENRMVRILTVERQGDGDTKP